MLKYSMYIIRLNEFCMDESQNIEYKAIWTHNPYGTSRKAVSRKREWARMREN